MSAYVMDSALFCDQFGTQAMRDIYSDRMTVQKWLDVEVALARAEAELGIIPSHAAEEIAANGDAGTYDLAALKREMDVTAHPIVPLVRAIAKKCSGDAGQYVHWGATTQDIMDTGQILQIKEAWTHIAGDLDAVEANLITLARTHRATPMPGRTHGLHAQPITFGYKVAIWLAEIGRHKERMVECAKRLFIGQFSGAVGTMAALGSAGPKVHERAMQLLGLSVPKICWHTARDTMAEYACLMAMIAGTMGKMAHEIYLLQKTETAEVEEPFPEGRIGSSTMPHKRNPALCESIVALSRTVRSAVPLALENLVAEHERDKIGLHAEREYVARITAQTHAAIKKTVTVSGGLTVRPAAMQRNLSVTGGLTLSEAVMMKLAETIGRQDAHEIVYKACIEVAQTGRDMKSVLLEVPTISEKISPAALDELLDPSAYTGLAAEFTDRVLADMESLGDRKI